MEQKHVSFKIAKAIKEAGYPQNIENWEYINDNVFLYFPDGTIERKKFINEYIDISKLILAPTYIDVWLWLWKEKGIQIELQYDKHESNAWCEIADDEYKEFDNKDPEEAIVAAIEYLVTNDLIK